ncbi:MAG: ABC transporter ATP-binding protein [Sedimentisphaerales bacterium]|nr:ABC transporter ATP-binding protein [Sedimentisphaerales bacterium]
MVDVKKNLVIETAGLTKIFRDFWGHQRVIAVEDLDLAIHPREVFGLLGPNGSGKSTTIKMLLGLLHITRGWARILGELPGDVRINTHIGYLPEETYLYPFLNARETLDFYGRLFGLSRHERQRRIESLLEMVGLTAVSRRQIGQYSKGMMRRIGLAQALINDPDLLILDEPTSGLDPIGTRQIKDLICELGRRGKTVLLCSHLLADVEDVCDQICILYGGKKQTEGAVREILVSNEASEIVSPLLKSETLTKIEDIIRHDYPDYQLDVHTPRERLEDLFLRIVSQAHAAELETSGAVIGSGIGDFLTDISGETDTSRRVLDQLVKGRTSQVESTAAGRGSGPSGVQLTPISETPVRPDVLDSLTAPSSSAPIPVDAEDEREYPLKKDESVDRSVIEGLLHKHIDSENEKDASKNHPDTHNGHNKT